MKLRATTFSLPGGRWLQFLLIVSLALQSFILPTFAQSSTEVNGNITYTNANGTVFYLQDGRKPTLYTGDFGDCQGNGVLNVTRFEAAFYRDNRTIAFHLQGNTTLPNDYVTVSLSFFMYGSTRYNLLFNPCGAGVNIASMCPMISTTPIDASGVVQVVEQDIASIPSIAFKLPDVEGQAILQIFSNTTQSQVACFAAAMTNGTTFSQTASVGTVLGIFCIIAIVASFATTLHGNSASTIRNTYAQSLSVCVVFAVLQHIYFTGALSVNWPSVLVSFWSNYAWTGGMIYTKSMQSSISNFVGKAVGNPSEVGAASTGNSNTGVYGGVPATTIFPRFNANYTGGSAVKPGFPLPGNSSGFAGTLAIEGIPLSNAFLTGFLWFLIAIVLISASITACAWIIKGLESVNLTRKGKFDFFRINWMLYTLMAVLRTAFVAFYMLIFLCLFQFAYTSSSGAKGLAALIFLIVFVGMLGAAGYACFFPIKTGKYVIEPARLQIGGKFLLQVKTQDFEGQASGTVPFFRFARSDADDISVHNDESYLKKFGWLSGRYHLSKFWFFAAWLVYDFVRACFLAGAVAHPLTQVFGLLVIEVFALVLVLMLKPFQGHRLNSLMVNLLGVYKVCTLALAATFDVRFNVNRVTCAAIGVAIIVLQSILTVALLGAILLGALSSYRACRGMPDDMLLSVKKPVPRRSSKRKPKPMEKRRESTKSSKSKPMVEVEKPANSYFKVNSITRMSKIEDEDEDFASEIGSNSIGLRSTSELNLSNVSRTQLRSSRRLSANGRPSSIRSNVSYSNLPYGARPHRMSWSSRDLDNIPDIDLSRMPLPMPPRIGGNMRSSPSSSATSLTSAPTSRPQDVPMPRRTDVFPSGQTSPDADYLDLKTKRQRPLSQPIPAYNSSRRYDLPENHASSLHPENEESVVGLARSTDQRASSGYQKTSEEVRKGKAVRPQRAVSHVF